MQNYKFIVVVIIAFFLGTIGKAYCGELADGEYVGKEPFVDLTPKNKEEKWFHKNVLTINGTKIILEKYPMSIKHGEISSSASDGGFYTFSGSIFIKNNKTYVRMKIIYCGYCGAVPVSGEYPTVEYEIKQLGDETVEINNVKYQMQKVRTIDSANKKVSSEVCADKIDRDVRFIPYNNGTVKDTETGLMWATKDNGKNINWEDAKRYCENYRGGGYADWRMPTLNELEELYDRSESYQPEHKSYNIHLTRLIRLTSCCLWASKKRGLQATNFDFHHGSQYWLGHSVSFDLRALPVRNGN